MMSGREGSAGGGAGPRREEEKGRRERFPI